MKKSFSLAAVGGVLLLFLLVHASVAEQKKPEASPGKNEALFTQIESAVWDKLSSNPNKNRWEVVKIIVQKVKESIPDKQGQVTFLEKAREMSSQKAQLNKGKVDATTHMWLSISLMKAKEIILKESGQ
ncbi:MAG: hypothetical protein WC539_06155 [Nitrospirota bacterium]